jgi:hypothetical protein
MQVFALVCFSGLLFMSEWRLIRLFHIHFSKDERKNRKKEKRKPVNRWVRGAVKVFEKNLTNTCTGMQNP